MSKNTVRGVIGLLSCMMASIVFVGSASALTIGDSVDLGSEGSYQALTINKKVGRVDFKCINTIYYAYVASFYSTSGSLIGKAAERTPVSPSGGSSIGSAWCMAKQDEVINKLKSEGLYGGDGTGLIPEECKHGFTGPLSTEQEKKCKELRDKMGIDEGVWGGGSKDPATGSGGESEDDGRGNLPTGGYEGKCTSILPESWCGDDNGQGIIYLLRIVLDILTAGVGILATIGLVISGIQYIMARDDAGKVARVKSRIFNVVIGLLAYGVMWIVLEWLIPGGVL